MATTLAYVSDNDAPDAKPPILRVYEFDAGASKPKTLAKMGDAGIPKDWAPADGNLDFSRDGHRLFFQIAPKPVVAKPDPTPEADKAQVDVWNWQDKILQSQQLMQATRERNKSYMATADLRSGRLTRESTDDIPSVNIGRHGEAAFGFASTSVPYELQESWDEGYSDLYRVEVATGKAIPLGAGQHTREFLSPDGNSVAVFDLATQRR